MPMSIGWAFRSEECEAKLSNIKNHDLIRGKDLNGRLVAVNELKILPAREPKECEEGFVETVTLAT